MTPKFVEHIVILCFEGWYPQKNRVIHLKSNILTPPNFFAPANFVGPKKFLGWLRYYCVSD